MVETLHVRREYLRMAGMSAVEWVAAIVVTSGLLILAGGAAAYINGRGPGAAASICAELRSQGMVPGASRGGRVLRSVSCSDNGHAFSIRGYLE